METYLVHSQTFNIFVATNYLKSKALKTFKQRHNLKTEKKNRIIIEEVNPNELAELWKKLSDLNKAF
jgi:restriction endonuclease